MDGSKLLKIYSQDVNQQYSPCPDYHMTFKLVLVIFLTMFQVQTFRNQTSRYLCNIKDKMH